MNDLNKPFSILHISDLHILPEPNDKMLGIRTEYYFNLILETAFQTQASYDLILVSGDLAQDPCTASYQRIATALKRYDTPCIFLPGNHDDWPLMQKLFNSGKMSCNKHHLFQHWQMICLNSQKLTDPKGLLELHELDFLTHSLKAQPNKHAMIAVHHHCTPSNSKWLDTMLIENHQAFFDRLRPFPQVKLIVNGHIHQVIETQIQGIDILTVPATCFQFKPNCKNFALDNIAPGYRVINLNPDGQIDSYVKRLDIDQSELHNNSEGY